MDNLYFVDSTQLWCDVASQFVPFCIVSTNSRQPLKKWKTFRKRDFFLKKRVCFSVRLAALDLKSSYIFLHWDVCSAASLPASPNRDGASGASILSWSTFIESTTSCTRQSLSSLLAANSMLIQIHNGCGKSLCCTGTTRLWKSKPKLKSCIG